MPRSAPFRLNRSGIMLALVSAAFAGEAGAVAGRAEFTIGGVTVAGRDGVERPLARGAELDNGDVVRTKDGRAQIRFTDGAYVSLQPNTEFGIREYRYDNRADGNERGFFGLLKGAMRTVTGAIGRINRDRYQITTPTATVGIRGTGGVIQVQDDGSTLVIGTSGIWSLTNPAGSVDVPAGNSAVAPTNPNQPPQETTQQPTSGPAPLPEEEPQFVAGDERTPEGNPVIVIPPPTLTPLVSGSGYQLASAFNAFESSVVNNERVDATFDALGRLTASTGSLQPTLTGGGFHAAESSTDGILAWGRWTGAVDFNGSPQSYGPDDGYHYVVGMPTPSLPTGGIATYALLGATQPTYVGGGTAPGTFKGSLSVDFAKLAVGLNLNIAMSDGPSYAVGGNASISGSTFSGSIDVFSRVGTLTVSGSGGACGGSGCSAFVNGFFAGASAERAGLGYHVLDTGSFKEVLGAAAFQKQ